MLGKLSLLLLAVLAPAVAGAATLRVERDGSGDFTTIQEAIDAASPGDLILLGPGRYTEVTIIESGITFRIHAYVTVDDLTFRGVDRDAVIIGPESGPPVQGNSGFVVDGAQTITIENMTFENLYRGPSVAGERLRVRGCRFVACGDTGVLSHALYETLVESCVFQGNDTGIVVTNIFNSTGVLIQNCLFENGSGGIDLQTEGNIVQGCTFRNNVVGLQFSFAATGSLLDSTLEDNWKGIVLTSGSICTLMNNRVYAGSGEVCIIVSLGSYGTGLGNIFEGGSYVTLLLDGESTLELSNCHILRSGPRPAVWAQSGTGPGHIIDLRNNYWGTNDAVEIAESIIDHQDYPEITDTVLFEPFLTDPVGAQAETFGGLKSRFGSRN